MSVTDRFLALQDFDSSFMGCKRQWNAYNTDCFIPLDTVIATVSWTLNYSSLDDVKNRKRRDNYHEQLSAVMAGGNKLCNSSLIS
jgi:hypothetical protein